MYTVSKYAPPVDRFWDRVMPMMDDQGCWEWVGRRSRKGYGTFEVGNRQVMATHFSWELHNGPKPPELQVLHRCDNPSCVNPAHLFLGTNQDNVRDREEKGRNKIHIAVAAAAAKRVARTHCPSGHPQDVWGRRWGAKQFRACYLCMKQRAKKRRDALR